MKKRLPAASKIQANRGELRLYVSGQSSRSLQSISTLRDLYEHTLSKTYVLEIVNVTHSPELALIDNVFVLPSLVMKSGSRSRILVGNLADRELILDWLNRYSMFSQSPS